MASSGIQQWPGPRHDRGRDRPGLCPPEPARRVSAGGTSGHSDGVLAQRRAVAQCLRDRKLHGRAGGSGEAGSGFLSADSPRQSASPQSRPRACGAKGRLGKALAQRRRSWRLRPVRLRELSGAGCRSRGVEGRSGSRPARRLRGRLRHRRQSRYRPGADPERGHLRRHGGAPWRDHAEEWSGRAKQFPRLPNAADERGAGDRGLHREEQRVAGRDGRGRNLRGRAGADQCDLGGDRQTHSQASGGESSCVTEVLILRPRMREVGHLQVRRLLPAAKRQAVGPFLFFDHFGPVELEPFSDADIGPHPHIGLSTVTYLFEGKLVHRDSIGSVQDIEPGAVNWMTAGRGIAHSERTPPELRGARRRAHGLQLWAGMPKALEDREPSFTHTDNPAIPEEEREHANVRVLVGRAWGMESPVTPVSETLYVDLSLPAGGRFDIPPVAPERALYAVAGAYRLEGTRMEPYAMVVLPAGDTVRVGAETPARVQALGRGPPHGARLLLGDFLSPRGGGVTEEAPPWSAHQTPRIEGEKDWMPLPRSLPL